MKHMLALLLVALVATGAFTGCTGGRTAASATQEGQSEVLSASLSAAPNSAAVAADESAQPERWPVVETASGPVEGKTEEGVTAFKGIPFAAPPLDDLRFAPPQKPQPWTQAMECFEYRDIPVQAKAEEGLSMSEDCLYLNIWAPEDAAEKKGLPVLVFIHGGAYASGSASLSMYNGTRFAKDGVIQVNVSYRLNALGFLPTQAALEEYGTPGNIGTMDQIMALEWVQENIAAFGGDKNNVTISGESAGAFSVSNMILSPLAEGLFTRAILESGNTLGQPLIAPDISGDMNQAIARGNDFAKELKAVNTMAEADLATLRALPAEDIAKESVFKANLTSPSPYYFFTVFDGMVLPEDPYGALKRGEINAVPILTGFNTDEGSMFIPSGLKTNTYTEFLENTFAGRAEEVQERFPVDAENTPTDRARHFIKMGLRFGNDAFADELSRQGQDVYYYQFDYSVDALEKQGLGTMHAMELPFVFDTLPEGLNLGEDAEAFKEDLHGRWLNFIKTGNPNGSPNQRGDDWPLYTPEGKEMLLLNAVPTAATLPNTEDAAYLCDLFWGGSGA